MNNELTVCQTCQCPHRGADCDNPGCFANPKIPEATKTKWREDFAKRSAEADERARIQRIRYRHKC